MDKAYIDIISMERGSWSAQILHNEIKTSVRNIEFNAWSWYPRQILMEGPLQLLDSGKPTEMFVILFDDMLLITRRKKALSKKVYFLCSQLCCTSFVTCEIKMKKMNASKKMFLMTFYMASFSFYSGAKV